MVKHIVVSRADIADAGAHYVSANSDINNKTGAASGFYYGNGAPSLAAANGVRKHPR